MLDGIYRDVVIDGIPVRADWARLYMVEKTLPFLNGRIQALRCPDCGEQLVDTRGSAAESAARCAGRRGFAPSSVHRCERCGRSFKTRRRVVSNPFVETLQRLQDFTDLPLREAGGWQVFRPAPPASYPSFSSPQNSCSQESPPLPSRP